MTDALPGFVDIQVNGFIGVDFSSPTLQVEAFRTACRELYRRGTSAFLPTLITNPPEVLERNLALIASVMDEPEFQGRLPGIHLEGPFISPEPGAVGAHRTECVVPPSIDLFDQFQAWADGKIRILTLAAERPGAEALVRHASAAGVCVALGHQLASEGDIRRMAAAGAKALTHLGNGLPQLINRHVNAIWAGLANDDLTATIITDGHHLPPAVIKTFLRAKGPDKSVVISDSMAVAGMPPGEYVMSGMPAVLEPNGLLRHRDRDCLAGSSATMLVCMNFLAAMDLLSYDELLAVGFKNPLALIDVDESAIDTTPRLRFNQRTLQFELLK